MKRIWGISKRKAFETRGATLAELIVALALTGLFMSFAVMFMSSGMRLYARVQSTTDAAIMARLLLDRIAEEISAANLPAEGEEGYYFWLDGEDPKHSKWVAFGDREQRPVAIYAAEEDDGGAPGTLGAGRLVIRYYEAGQEEEESWQFGAGIYQGYHIETLFFSRDEPELHPEVVRIDLTLKNDKTGFGYSAFQYAKNYNVGSARRYMCARNDGRNGMPVRAEEFWVASEEILESDFAQEDGLAGARGSKRE